MKILITFLFVLFSFFSNSQENLKIGVGILDIEFSSDLVLNFFNDTLQLKPTSSISLGITKAGDYILKNSDKNSSWFEPEQLSIDAEILVLRVDTNIGKWHKVIINSNTGKSLWLKKQKNFSYFDWKSFFKERVTAITRGNQEIEIKFLPNETSKTIKKMETVDCFEVLEVKGDWLKVKTNSKLECSESNQPIKGGWIKWKQKNKLTISYGLSC